MDSCVVSPDDSSDGRVCLHVTCEYMSIRAGSIFRRRRHFAM